MSEEGFLAGVRPGASTRKSEKTVRALREAQERRQAKESFKLNMTHMKQKPFSLFPQQFQ